MFGVRLDEELENKSAATAQLRGVSKSELARAAATPFRPVIAPNAGTGAGITVGGDGGQVGALAPSQLLLVDQSLRLWLGLASTA